MPLSEADVIKIVEGSSRLAERTDRHFDLSGKPSAEAEKRRERLKALSSGPWEPPPSILSDVKLRTDHPLPRWTETLRDVSTSIQESFSNPAQPPTFGGGTLPFVHLFLPVAEFAKSRCVARLKAAASLLNKKAWRDLEAQLLARLTNLWALALQAEFFAFAAVRRSQLFPSSKTDTADSQYAAFVREAGTEGMAGFFRRYSVAARLSALLTDQWISASVEFIGRLEKDYPALCNLTLGAPTLGPVTAIRGNIADPHEGGRSTMIVRFCGVMKVVYKPRCVKVEAALFDLLGWLNTKGEMPKQRVLRVAAREGYGWIEYCAHGECADAAGADRFYGRAGFLLAVAHALRGVDFHRENVIAAGEYPVLIDLEGLGHPNLRQQPSEKRQCREQIVIDKSVLRTGLLPLWQASPLGDRHVNISGIGSPAKLRSPVPGLRWRFVNSDKMMLEAAKRLHRGRHHPATRAGRVAATEHLRAITEGFVSGCSLLRRLKTQRGFRSRVAAIFRAKRRLIRRATTVYSTMIRIGQHPNLLRNGIERSIELRALPWLPGDSLDSYDRELESLENLDIPFFTITSSVNGMPRLHIPSAAEEAREAAIIRLSLEKRLFSCNGIASPTRHYE